MARYTIDFSTNASAIVREIEKVNAAIAKTTRTGKSVSIDIDTSQLNQSINASFKQLDKQIAKYQRQLRKLQIGSPQFVGLAGQIGAREGVRERGRMQAQAAGLREQAFAFEPGSAVALTKALQAAKIEASQVKPASEEWLSLQKRIALLTFDLQKADRLADSIQMQQNLGAFSPGSLNALEAKLVILRNRAREISPNTTEWKALNKELIQTEQAVEKQTRRPLTTGQRLGAAGGAFLYGGGLGGGIGSAIGGIAGGLAGGVPGAFAGAAVGQAVDNLGAYAAQIAKTVAEVNKAKISLAGVTRNVNDYDFALQSATEAGSKFLLPIADATRQFTKLQASVVGAGYQTKDTKQVFDGIAAAIIATGGTVEDLNGALTATSQVFSKGKVTAEELRGQIGERLPGAFTIFAQSINKTPQELDKALEKGQVSLSDFLSFTQELTRRYSSTAEQLATAPENAGARLQVALQAASVSYAGFFQVIGAGFQDQITRVIAFAVENENSIKRVVTVFAAGFSTIGGLISKFTSFLVNAFNKAFTVLLGNLDTVIARIEDAINRASAAGSITEGQIRNFQEQATKATKERFGVRVGGINTGLIADQQKASQFYNQYFNNLIDTATKARNKTKYTDKLKQVLFPEFKPSAFGAGLGANQGAGAMAPAGAEEKKKKGKELDKYIADATKLFAQEKENALLKIEDQLLTEKLNEAEAKQQSSLVEKLYEEKAVRESLRVATEKLKEENLSAADKTLKLSDLQLEASKELENIQKKYGVEVLKAQVSLQQPLKDAVESTNSEITKQVMLQEALSNGVGDLTADQKAYLDVQQLTKDFTDAQRESSIALINQLQRQREEYYKNEEVIKRQQSLYQAINELQITGGGLRAGFTGSAAGVFERSMIESQGNVDFSVQMANIETQAMKLRSVFEGLQSAIGGVSSAFGSVLTEGIANMISGTATAKEVFAEFLRSIGQSLLSAAGQMIATYTAIGIARIFAGMGGGGGGLEPSTAAGNAAFMQRTGALGFANGGIAPGGFRAFANGGIVTGPTLGLVGEGRYNEAVVPLPDGKSIPVQLGGRTARDLMGGNAPGMPQQTSLNMNFETTKINGVEYVSREQLEQAMAETRRASISGGARQGMAMTLDKIRQSPSTRSRIGMR